MTTGAIVGHGNGSLGNTTSNVSHTRENGEIGGLAVTDAQAAGVGSSGLSYVSYFTAKRAKLQKKSEGIHAWQRKIAETFEVKEVAQNWIKSTESGIVSFREGASLVQVSVGHSVRKKDRRVTWTRGMIKGFSRQSRRRILRIVATIKRIEKPVFITCTYPDEFPTEGAAMKKHLDTFFKRIIRGYPDAIILWRLEPQKRKSGMNKGEIAPHYHMLIWKVPYSDLREWIPVNWYEVVNSGDEKHLSAGTRVERVRSVHGVLNYTSKYICKSLEFVVEGWGRYWGIINRDDFKTIQGTSTSVRIDSKTAQTVLRYMRRRGSELYKKNKKTGVNEYVGRRKTPKHGRKYTLICDSDFWQRTLPKIIESAS